MSSSPDRAAAADPVAMGVRTGPIGRALRVLGAVFLGAGVYVLADIGITGFRDLDQLRVPAPWILTVVVAVLIVDLVTRFVPLARRQRMMVLAAIAAVVVLAAVVSLASGSLWGSPLSDMVWLVDVGYLGYATASLLLAVVLGTPGCENLAWAELRARLRGDRSPVSGVWCIGGMHVVDNWELGRRAQRHAQEEARRQAPA